MLWTLAEAISAAAALREVTQKPEYATWYETFMEHFDGTVLDHANGSWFHQLNSSIEVMTTVWPGKPDIYHALQSSSAIRRHKLHCLPPEGKARLYVNLELFLSIQKKRCLTGNAFFGWNSSLGFHRSALCR